MSKTKYYIDRADVASVEALIDAFEARDTDYETAIRAVLNLHNRSFTLQIDYASRLQVSPLEDAFNFDTQTQELVLFADQPTVLVDGILEMALFLRGFETMISAADEWKMQFTIGIWRHIRKTIKRGLKLDEESTWRVGLEPDKVERYNAASFDAMVFLAGRPEVEVTFPAGTNAIVIWAYQRLARVMETIAFEIDLDDHLIFNQRLARGLALVEDTIMPGDPSPFDELLGPEGFEDRFFEDESAPLD